MKKNILITLFSSLTLVLGGCSEESEPVAAQTTIAETTPVTTTTAETTSAEETTEEAVITVEITKATEEMPVEEETNSGKVTYTSESYATIKENHIDIYPTKVWYEGEQFVANCMVTNGFDVDKIITSIPYFIINDVNGDEIANARFDSVNLTVPAGNYVMHTFTFSGEALTNTNADYSKYSCKTDILSVSAEETDSGTVTDPTESYAVIKENHIDIYPAEAWYEGEKFVVSCIVTNGFDVDKIITRIPTFIINDVNGDEIANARFDSVNLTVPAGDYAMHTFTLSGEALTNTNADYSNISWDVDIYFDDVSVPVTTLASTSQTVMDEKVKLTAEKRSDNTIILIIENSLENEVSTFGYPQVRANGTIQELDKHLQLKNGTQDLTVPAGEKGQIVYYVDDADSVEALIGSLHTLSSNITDREFKLEF